MSGRLSARAVLLAALAAAAAAAVVSPGSAQPPPASAAPEPPSARSLSYRMSVLARTRVLDRQLRLVLGPLQGGLMPVGTVLEARFDGTISNAYSLGPPAAEQRRDARSGSARAPSVSAARTTSG